MERFAIWAIGAGIVVLAVSVAALALRVRHLAQAVRKGGQEGAARTLREHEQTLADVRRSVEGTRTALAELAAQLETCVQRVGLVRFDAFEDVGGKISFSLALLDAKGDGVVLSVLNGRETVRAYAKAVVAGKASHPLSEEEKNALALAREGRMYDG
jgi:hypothetical protein